MEEIINSVIIGEIKRALVNCENAEETCVAIESIIDTGEKIIKSINEADSEKKRRESK